MGTKRGVKLGVLLMLLVVVSLIFFLQSGNEEISINNTVFQNISAQDSGLGIIETEDLVSPNSSSVLVTTSESEIAIEDSLGKEPEPVIDELLIEEESPSSGGSSKKTTSESSSYVEDSSQGITGGVVSSKKTSGSVGSSDLVDSPIDDGIVVGDPLIGDGNDVYGCTDSNACNHDQLANVNDGSCTYLDCNGDCGGTAVVDNCGVCSGGNSGHTANSDLDCDGVCFGNSYLDECGVCDSSSENDCTQDCNDEWGGTAQLDDCGVCGGEGIPTGACDCDGNVNDCAGVCGGSSYIDECGTCDDNPTNDCVQDCANVWGGDSWISDCGCVAADNLGDDCDDCAGTPNGNSYLDECGVCDSSSENDCTQDCNGEWGGTAQIDDCGVCGGEGIPTGACDCDGNVNDCAGVCGGNSDIDPCGQCQSNSVCYKIEASLGSYPNEVSWELNPGEITGGAPYLEECIYLMDGDYTLSMSDQYSDGWQGTQWSISNQEGEIIQSCALPDCFGTDEQVCLNCEEGWDCGSAQCLFTLNAESESSCSQDCAGVWGGDSWESDCGCVAAGNSGDDCDDCAGVPNGVALIDDCGDCSSPDNYNSGQDCAGVCNGYSYVDSCGVCDSLTENDCVQDCAGVWGGTVEVDCNGECGGTYVVDNCGTCVSPSNEDCVCGIIDDDLTLTSDISTSGDCFTIGADDVSIDCAGHNIIFSTDTYISGHSAFLNQGYDNVEIKNCNIYDTSMDLFSNEGESYTLANSLGSSTETYLNYGIYFTGNGSYGAGMSSQNGDSYDGYDLSGCDFVNNDDDYSKNGRISNNKISTYFGAGIYLGHTAGNILSNNRVHINPNGGALAVIEDYAPNPNEYKFENEFGKFSIGEKDCLEESDFTLLKSVYLSPSESPEFENLFIVKNSLRIDPILLSQKVEISLYDVDINNAVPFLNGEKCGSACSSFTKFTVGGINNYKFTYTPTVEYFDNEIIKSMGEKALSSSISIQSNHTMFEFSIGANSTYFTECMEISSPGEYVLNDSILSSSVDYCITISADNVTLHCNGNQIEGDTYANYGIYVYRDNLENSNVNITNCSISQWDKAGIYFRRGGNNIIDNTDLSQNLYGLHLFESDNNFISGVHAEENIQDGIFLESSDNNLIYEYSNYNDGLAGLGILLSDNNTIWNSVFSGNNYSILDKSGDGRINHLLYSNEHGLLRWNDEDFLSNITLTSNISTWGNFFNISNNLIGVYDDEFDPVDRPKINSPAYLELYNVSGIVKPNVSKDGLPCGSICSDVDGDENNYSFTVEHFTNYSLYDINLDFNISDCTDLNVSGGTYYLNQSIINTTISYCMNVSANQVTLDCQGNMIDGNGSTVMGIYLNRDIQENTGFEVRNCIVSDWNESGLYFAYADDNIVTNSSFDSCPDGSLRMINSNDNWFDLLEITNSGLFGAFGLHNSSYNTLKDSNLSNILYYGLDIVNDSSHNVFDNISISDGLDVQSFYIRDSVDIIFNSIDIKNTEAAGMIYNSGMIYFSDVDISNQGYGIEIYDSSGINLTNLMITNTTVMDHLYIVNSQQISLKDSVFDSAYSYSGIYFDNVDTAILNNVTSKNNHVDGLYLDNSQNIDVFNSYFINNSDYGIFLHDSHSNHFYNVEAINNTDASIYDSTNSAYINYVTYENQYGEMKLIDPMFEQDITLEGQIGHGTNLFIEHNNITFNVSPFSDKANSTALLKYIGVFDYANPGLYLNGEFCSDCVLINSSFITGEFTFEVPHFSSYTIGKNVEEINSCQELWEEGTIYELTEDVTSDDMAVDACNLPLNTITYYNGSVYYNIGTDIAGFQFDVSGADINSASGGEAGAALSIILHSNTTVLAYSLVGGNISTNCGTLLDLNLTNELIDIYGIIFSDVNGESIFPYVTFNNPDDQDCFSLTNNEVELDCQGFEITGSTDYGISIDRDDQQQTNASIRNCVIDGFDLAGVYLKNADNNVIENVTVKKNKLDGIYMIYSDDNLISEVTTRNNARHGINVLHCKDNLFEDSISFNNGENGFELYQSQSNILDNLTLAQNQMGLYLEHADGNLFLNNEIEDNDEQEIFDFTDELYNNHLIYNNSHGMIKWINQSFLTDMNIEGNLNDSTINISNNSININISAFSDSLINSTAIITVYNLNISNFSNPFPIIDGEYCWECYDFSNTSDSFTFTTPHFTNFTIEEGPVHLTGCSELNVEGEYYILDNNITGIDPSLLNNNQIYLLNNSLYYHIEDDISEFMFTISGANITVASGGEAGAANFSITIASGNVVTVKSTTTNITEDYGVLIELDMNTSNFYDSNFSINYFIDDEDNNIPINYDPGYSINACMGVNADGITLDCQGKTMAGFVDDGGDYPGIFVRDSNEIIIKNCFIEGYNDGVEFDNSSNSLLKDSTLINNSESGVEIYDGSNNLLSNLSVSNSGRHGVELDSNYSILINSNITNNGEIGVSIGRASGVSVTDSVIANNTLTDLMTFFTDEGPFTFDGFCDHKIENLTGTGSKPILFFNETVEIVGWENNASQIIICRTENSSIKDSSFSQNSELNIVNDEGFPFFMNYLSLIFLDTTGLTLEEITIENSSIFSPFQSNSFYQNVSINSGSFFSSIQDSLFSDIRFTGVSSSNIISNRSNFNSFSYGDGSFLTMGGIFSNYSNFNVGNESGLILTGSNSSFSNFTSGNGSFNYLIPLAGIFDNEDNISNDSMFIFSENNIFHNFNLGGPFAISDSRDNLFSSFEINSMGVNLSMLNSSEEIDMFGDEMFSSGLIIKLDFDGGDDFPSVYNNTFLNFNITAESEEILDFSNSTTVNFLVYNNSYGEIRWLDETFLSNLTLEGELSFEENPWIEQNNIGVDVSGFSNTLINSSAKLTFYNPGNFSTPEAFIDGLICEGCSNFTSENGSYSFITPHFTSFSIGDGGYIDVLDCGANINESGETYRLANDLNYSGSDTCLNLSLSDITLDCNEKKLIGNNTGTAFRIEHVDNVTVKDCFIQNFSWGVMVGNSTGTVIENNVISQNNKHGIILGTENGNYPVFDSSVISNTLIDNRWGIGLDNVTGSNISYNLITNSTEEALLLIETNNSNFYNNELNDNLIGLSITDSSNNNITTNLILSSNSTNSIGINLTNSNDNNIFNNYFDNQHNAYDDGTNNWNTTYSCSVNYTNIANGNCTGGNYWSNYGGVDNGNGVAPYNVSPWNISGDLIGDTNISYNNSDNISMGGDYLPLVYQCISNWEYGTWSNCTDGSKTRNVIDTNLCEDDYVETSTSGCTSSGSGSSGGSSGGGGSGGSSNSHNSGPATGAENSVSTHIEGQFHKEIWSLIYEGELVKLFIGDPTVAFQSLEFILEKDMKGVWVEIETVEKDEIEEEFINNVYQYIKVTKGSSLDGEYIEEFDINFAVSNAWLDMNNLDVNDISLFHYINDEWVEESTTYLNTDSELTYYHASVGDFSYFAVSSNSGVTTPSTSVELDSNQETYQEETYVQQPQTTPSTGLVEPDQAQPNSVSFMTKISDNLSLIFIVLIAIIISISVLMFLLHHKPSKGHSTSIAASNLDQAMSFAKLELDSGLEKEVIIKHLSDSGWNEEEIEKIFSAIDLMKTGPDTSNLKEF